MSKYFRYFPTTGHDLTNVGQTVRLTNILRRFKIKSSVADNVSVFYDYSIQSHDRPDTIAAKYYGDAGYAWVVMMYNEISDPIFDWPLFGNSFDEYIIGKYREQAESDLGRTLTGGEVIAWTGGEVYEYRQILNAGQLSYNTETGRYENKSLYDGSTTSKRYIVIDATTYATLDEDNRESVSIYDWESEKNEAKRNIRILDKRYLSLVRDQAKSIIRTGI